ISRFGLMQITRQRVRPELDISTTELCPTCHGTGKITSSLLITDELESKIKYLLKNNYKKLRLHVNPVLYAYLKKGVYDKQWKWFLSLGQWIHLKSDSSCHLIQYRFFDANGEEIKI